MQALLIQRACHSIMKVQKVNYLNSQKRYMKSKGIEVMVDFYQITYMLNKLMLLARERLLGLLEI